MSGSHTVIHGCAAATSSVTATVPTAGPAASSAPQLGLSKQPGSPRSHKPPERLLTNKIQPTVLGNDAGLLNRLSEFPQK